MSTGFDDPRSENEVPVTGAYDRRDRPTGIGTAAERPAANKVPRNSFFFSTDTNQLDFSNGSSWVSAAGASTTTVTNWNDATENGWYMGNSATNGPGSGGWYIGFVVAHDTLWITQEVWKFTHSIYTLAPRFIRRSYDSSGRTWGAWKPVFVGGSCQAVDAGLALSSSLSGVSWDYLNHDDFGGNSAATSGGAMYAPVAGRYRVTAVLECYSQTGTGNNDFYIRLYDSGGGGAYFQTGAHPNLNQGGSCTQIVYMASGSYLTPTVKTTATGTAGSCNIWMTLELLAPDG